MEKLTWGWVLDTAFKFLVVTMAISMVAGFVFGFIAALMGR